MNLFRKETFSIRKFKVGIFSTLIATVAFWSSTHTHLAQADETNSQPVDDVQKLQEITSNGQLDNKEELKIIKKQYPKRVFLMFQIKSIPIMIL